MAARKACAVPVTLVTFGDWQPVLVFSRYAGECSPKRLPRETVLFDRSPVEFLTPFSCSFYDLAKLTLLGLSSSEGSPSCKCCSCHKNSMRKSKIPNGVPFDRRVQSLLHNSVQQGSLPCVVVRSSLGRSPDVPRRELRDLI